jgi:hypothetical protein
MTTPLALCEPRRVTMPISHSSEQGTLPTTSIISKQAISYRTRGGTYCPGVSTPMTQSLADSSMNPSYSLVMGSMGHGGPVVTAWFGQTSTVAGSPLGGAPAPRT